MWNNNNNNIIIIIIIITIIVIIIIIIIIIITFIIINKRGSYVKCNEIGVAWHYSTWRRHFQFMQITFILPAFFDEAEKKISNGSTTKFILYVRKRLHGKIGACIRPVTIMH